MPLFALAGLLVGIFCLFLAFLVFIFAKQKAHYLWGLFNIIVALWAFGIYFAGISQTASAAIFQWKLVYLPGTFISVVYYHVISEFCGIRRRGMLFFAYIQG